MFKTRLLFLVFKIEETKVFADENDLLEKEKLIIWERGCKITKRVPLSREMGCDLF